MKQTSRIFFAFALCLLSNAVFAKPIHYRGTYQGSGLPLIADAYLIETIITTPTVPATPKIRLILTVCLDGAAQTRRSLELVALDPVKDLAEFKMVNSSNPKDMELTYSSKWKTLEGHFYEGDEGAEAPHFSLKQLEVDSPECSNE
jgi:hypothetical protein